tara:strand:- start:848 stop:1294 length:447 start_codon:yes stop_codon:yes gene_type:complete
MGNPAVMMAISVGSTLMSAKLQRDAYEAEAEANEEQAQMAGIEADQQENARRNQLLGILSALNVSESSRGLSIGQGGSSSALKENEKKFADADISSIKLMGLSKKRQFRLSADSARLSGKASIVSGLTSAGTSYYDYKSSKPKRSIRN